MRVAKPKTTRNQKKFVLNGIIIFPNSFMVRFKAKPIKLSPTK